jgi:hypothetical protein
LDLAEFVHRFPGVRVAQSSDNDALLEFFHRTQMRGKAFDLFYDRSPDFFAFLHLHSQDFRVLIYENEHRQIQAVATFLFRLGWIDGKLQRVCYLGDLRIGFDRRVLAFWRKAYSEIISSRLHIQELSKVQAFYTVLIMQNKQAQKSLLEAKRVQYRYDRVTDYHMVNVLFPKKIFLRTTAENLQSSDLSELVRFYENNQGSCFADYLWPEEITQRLEKWPQFSIKNFLVVKKDQQILAATALWSPSTFKKIKLSRPPWWWRLLGRGEDLRIGYLSHLKFAKNLDPKERQDCFHQMLTKAWSQKQEFQILSYCSFDQVPLEATGFFSQKIPMSIFEVTDIHSKLCLPRKDYGFEMALV